MTAQAHALAPWIALTAALALSGCPSWDKTFDEEQGDDDDNDSPDDDSGDDDDDDDGSQCCRLSDPCSLGNNNECECPLMPWDWTDCALDDDNDDNDNDDSGKTAGAVSDR